MTAVWLTPVAFWGLATLALPVVIHLLTRQRTRQLLFPTLRFLRATRLAALRRRAVQDWWLLAIRLLTLTAAVAALAGPVFVSPARQDAWRGRIARAFVLAPAVAAEHESLVATERQGSFSSEVFRPATHIADGIRDAVLWLERQPPALREVVIAGDIRDGALSAADVALVPAATGIRFLPIGGSPGFAQFDLHSLQVEDGVTRRWRTRTTLLADRTRVEYFVDRTTPGPVRANHRSLEPNAIHAQELAAWSRPPRGAAGLPADEGDRRWLWGAALLFLAVETWARRTRPVSARSLTAGEETRVA